jgi:peptidoglycan/LPS O-acetylase OafA/YrhL
MLSGVYLIVIMNVGRIGWLENPLLNTLGGVSYGIYLYHAPIAYLVLTALARSGVGVVDVIYYPAVMGLTLAAAFASYRWFERPFLELKPQTASAPLATQS